MMSAHGGDLLSPVWLVGLGQMLGAHGLTYEA